MRSDLSTACGTLFGWNEDEAPGRLAALGAAGVHAAFRRRAKDLHPDRARLLGQDPVALTARFFELEASRAHLLRHLRRPARLDHEPARARETFALPSPAGKRALPESPLCFGQYLYYLGRIPWEAVGSALRWQREKSLRLGELAREWRLLTEAEVGVVRRARRPRERFGDTARRLGYLNPYECDTLVDAQRVAHRKVGQYFVEAGAFTAAELCVLVQHQREHNRRFVGASR